MDRANKEYQPIHYTICIKNHLDSSWERWFEGMSITHAENGVMILSGEMVDQSALLGLLERIHSLNLSLISFQKVSPEKGE
jgi:hypothetical protein